MWLLSPCYGTMLQATLLEMKSNSNEQTTFSSPKTTVNPKLPAFSTIFASTLSPVMIFYVQAVPVAHLATVTVSLDAHLLKRHLTLPPASLGKTTREALLLQPLIPIIKTNPHQANRSSLQHRACGTLTLKHVQVAIPAYHPYIPSVHTK